MASPSNRQAARIKLNELQRQRDRLDEHYGAIEQRAAQAATPLERLRILYDGLRSATFAQKPLHPEVANLEALFLQGRVGNVSAELVAAWVQRLERELAHGRLRAEFAHAFGRLLDEAPQQPAAQASIDPALALADTHEEPDNFDLEFLNQLFEGFDARALEGFRQQVQVFASHGAIAAATDEEVTALLTLISKDNTRTASLRREAAAALGSPTQLHEYAGVLTILLANLAEWDWPAEGLPRQAVLLRDKPRLFLQEDLVTALFLQLVGVRWGIELKRLHRTLLQAAGSGLIPAPGEWRTSVLSMRSNHARILFLPMIPDSLREWTRTGAYGGNKQEDQLRLLHAEIRFQRTAWPKQPLFVVKADLRNYYPRIPHPVLLRLLERLGVPDNWRQFLARYLHVRVQSPDGVRVVQRGVALDFRLSDLLAEYLLLLLDIHVEKQTGVWLLRVVDDIYFLTESAESARRAWEAIGRFCDACGLAINAEKSGSVLLGGQTAESLPAGPVTWGVLHLDPVGAWRLHEPTFQRLQDWARRQAEGSGTTMQMVRSFNEALRFLFGCLGLTVQLGPEHLEAVGQRLARMQQDLFGPGHGIAEELRRRLSRQFRDSRLQQRGLPHALLYWPITAGGLGLLQPLIMIMAHNRGLQAVPAPEPPSRPRPVKQSSEGVSELGPQASLGQLAFQPLNLGGDWLQSNEWTQYYQQLLMAVAPQNPTATPNFQNLVKDFIARGTEVAGRKQAGLRPYWQWILYTYGPPLLEALGTFRFLLTELVPLGLVFAQGGMGAEELESSSEQGGAEEIPF